MKKTLKILLYFLLAVSCLYLGFVFFYGGFGKKAPVYTSVGKNEKTLLFAHRGMYLYYPENSMEGIDGAKAHGFRAAEVDIRRSADNHLIIFHDDSCQRILGVDKMVNALTLAELKKYPIRLQNGQKSTSFITSVDELLAAEKGMVFYFDMKLSSFKDADDVVQLIKKHGCEHSVILANSNAAFIFYVEAKYPKIMTVLEGFDTGKEWMYYFIPKDLKPDFLSGFYSATNEAHVSWLKNNGLLDCKIVYGVGLKNYRAALISGFKNILIDYDSLMEKDPQIKELLEK